MTARRIHQEDDVPFEKLQEAVGCLVRDLDGKYDECLVDQFIEVVYKRRLTFEIFRGIVMDLYKSDSTDVNPIRLFKFHKLCLETALDDHSKDLNNLLWKRLPSIIESDNPAVISAALSLLHDLADRENGIWCTMDKRFKRPIKLPIEMQYEVEDVAVLAKYYMQTSKNYHIQNLATRLFVELVSKSCLDLTSPLPRLMVSSKKVLEEMLESRSPAIYHAIFSLLNLTAPDLRHLLSEGYDLQTLIKKNFDALLKEGSSQLAIITKCLAVVTATKDIPSVIDRLRSRGHLESIITFIVHLQGEQVTQPLFMYIVYPILTKCDSEDAQLLVQKLFITRGEKDFIDRHMKDKLVIICITYLKKYLQKKTGSANYYTIVHQKKVMYYFNVLREYYRCNYNSMNAYRYVLECCSILREASHILRQRNELIWLFELIEDCHKIIEEIDWSQPHKKTILLETIQILKASRYGVSILRLPKLQETSVKTMDLAYKFDDPEILNEFADFFIMNSFEFVRRASAFGDSIRYVKLIWEYMRPKALASDHQEFLGRVVQLLVSIDLDALDIALKHAQIEQHREIPQLIGDTLINYSTVHPTVELVIDRIRYRARSSVDRLQTSGEEIVDYLHSLDTDKASFFAVVPRMGLDHIIKGLCVTVRGESRTTTRRYALEQICQLVPFLLVNAKDESSYLDRLARTGTLEIMYEVLTNHMYPWLFYKLAKEKYSLIRRQILKQINNEHEIAYIACLIRQGNEDCTSERSLDIVRFFIENVNIDREAVPIDAGLEITISSYVEDILNQQRISKGISECY